MSSIGYTLSTSCRETGIKIIVEKDDEGNAGVMSSCTQVKDVYAMDHVQPAMIGSQSHYGHNLVAYMSFDLGEGNGDPDTMASSQ